MAFRNWAHCLCNHFSIDSGSRHRIVSTSNPLVIVKLESRPRHHHSLTGIREWARQIMHFLMARGLLGYATMERENSKNHSMSMMSGVINSPNHMGFYP